MSNKYHKPHGDGKPISGKEYARREARRKAKVEKRGLPSDPVWQGFRSE